MAKSRAAWSPARNGRADQPGKKLRPVRAACWAGGQLGQHVGADEVLDRVVAEEGGEQRRHRRQVGRPARPRRPARRGPPARGAGCAGSDDESPTIIRVKKMPMERTWAEFWNVVFMPEPAPRCCGGRLFITPARLGEPNDAMHRPVTKSRTAKTQ